MRAPAEWVESACRRGGEQLQNDEATDLKVESTRLCTRLIST